VEDEPSILKMSRLFLERLGYRVLSAATPAEAINPAREHAAEIHLLMTDVIMPDMNSQDLADHRRSVMRSIRLLIFFSCLS
jgi:CheY-like chemotaxis protein